MDVNVFLFPDFETLDAFGPVEVLGRIEQYTLCYVSMNGGLITSRQGTQILTKSVDEADYSGILLLPGGQGTRCLVDDAAFIRTLTGISQQAMYCLAVCTGSALLAKTGLLDNRKATSNKKAFAWVKSTNGNVTWIEKARWVVDEKYYTSSGISAGIDMTLGFIADRFGNKKAEEIAEAIEYIWNTDSTNDQFST
ncbi:DJ-1/PfpI family protein [Parasphaerochaeta coccoides]|uniref:ThiJ/PfpI domain-containing protein n=1 Tax=Parasphaerochaeta coccoides (strain ATCC BAA-1237 / DSM 17374 / SPN1) TaxID=760011 RepID=F4GHB1_PARC1|nr:DJ-1/PfpI family protein [Parasphaerochaeta coccoides]AEC02010.1 ThiJ/PfpI domain-containing protein [Parasphaerochaeta coccoides DSM 17374]